MTGYMPFFIIAIVALLGGIIVSVFLHFGTKFRITKDGIAFGFKKYSSSDLAKYSFDVEKYKYTQHDLPVGVRSTPKIWKGAWSVRVDVSQHEEILYTHLLSVSNEKKADELMVKVNDGIRRR